MSYKPLIDAIALAHNLPRPEAEYYFAKPRRYRFDFAWPALKLAIEIDGGIYGQGKPCPVCKQRRVAGHGSIQRQRTDREKMRLAALDGWIVCPFLVEDLRNGTLADSLPALLQSRLASLTRSSPPTT